MNAPPGGLDWSDVSSPQHSTDDVSVTPHEFPVPPLTDVNVQNANALLPEETNRTAASDSARPSNRIMRDPSRAACGDARLRAK
jgi:hypothetical protein